MGFSSGRVDRTTRVCSDEGVAQLLLRAGGIVHRDHIGPNHRLGARGTLPIPRQRIPKSDNCRVAASAASPAFSPPRTGTPLAPSLPMRSEEHTSELQSLRHLVCRLLLD